ncbi:branched-chain amino acid ABC transporter permease [Desulforhopalus singaporensis]|uniref:Branched-chain amino acid transport system permease protein n=1 Tax=Desulforhopalus singaporensis TaxID=91360 RepID=A0A1H0U2K6_9BACT|nr:branched-chain amino acid ABC transporter permease [Desulforhopalus singaporensis]SDP60507.1 branched-chain amino acid transport system permease protein [Desulforhopalus singaporensis]
MFQMIQKSFWEQVRKFNSLAGISIIITIVVALAATIDRGGYLLVNTIVTGGMLALVSMGLALTLGVLNIPMFAHGEFFMIGTLVGYYVFNAISAYVGSHPESSLVFWGPMLTIVAAMIIGAVAGVITELLIFRQLRKRSRENWVMNAFLLTVGLSVVLVNGHQLFFGADFKGIVGYYSGPSLAIMDVYISRDRVFALIVAAVVVALFWFFMTYTRTGRAIRAVSQDETGALIVGIGLNGILMLTMSLSCALAAIAGAGLLFMYPSYPSIGLEPLYMAWFVVILAGLGNVLGAVMCSFMVALLKVLTIEYIGSGWDFVVPSILIILILIFKPSGIFGSEVRGVLDK